MFDNPVERRETHCAKWDELIENTGEEEIIPLTVADMDFRVAPEIMHAVMEAANHGVYGYTNVSESSIALTQQWIQNHHHWEAQREWIIYCPRVINAICQIIQNFTQRGDSVLILAPLYDPIQSAILNNGRKLIRTSLVYDGNHFEIDFNDFEQKIKSGVKVFIAVSPHNPTGRVWNEEEVAKMVHLCKENHVLIVADEVHADFIWKGTFTSFGQFYDEYDQMIIGTSPSKTFNIPGIEASSIIIKEKTLREKFSDCLKSAGFHNPNYFCNSAVEAAYGEGGEWLTLVKQTILENRVHAISFIDRECVPCKVVPGEGTFLLWVDYSALGIAEDVLNQKLLHKGKVACSMGGNFGEEGRGFFRINVAQPPAIFNQALERIKKVVEEVKK
ncbi:MAG: PatB family C-S lyase [Peptoniphilaceae bacterium]|nr:PatB family C-S lyase [Peptoniphilaceae bacterium]